MSLGTGAIDELGNWFRERMVDPQKYKAQQGGFMATL